MPNLLVLVIPSIFRSPNDNFKFLIFVPCFALFHWPNYCENLAKCPSSKLFLIVLSLILFLNHFIWSFVTQDMTTLLRLAELVFNPEFWACLGSGSFGQLILGGKMTIVQIFILHFLYLLAFCDLYSLIYYS